jgi:hypothetical protein
MTDLDHADFLALGVVWRTSPLPIVSPHAKQESSPEIGRKMRGLDATYVGESGGRHFDRFPGFQWAVSARGVSEICRRCEMRMRCGVPESARKSAQ